MSWKYHNDDRSAYEERIQEMHSHNGGNEPLAEHEIHDLEREHRIYTNGRTIHFDDDISNY